MRATLKLKAIAFAWLLALSAFPGAATASLITMDFEQTPVGQYHGAFVSNGFVLDPGARDWSPDAVPFPQGGPWTGHYHIDDPTVRPTDNATNYLVFDFFLDSSILNIDSVSDGVFGMQRFDLARTPTPGVPAIEVTFIGYLPDGGTISRHETLDPITDGVTRFKTYEFDDAWDRLTMFTIFPSHEFANPGIDNIVLSKVPEPDTLALVGLAALLLARRGRLPARPKA